MLADLDRLVGRQSEPRRAYVPRERFRVRHEPTYELTYHDTLLRHLAPLLDALEEFLRVRQSAIEVLVLRLAHRERAERGIPPCTQLVLRLSSADFLAARFALLLAEQLARIELPAPVVRFDLYSGVLRPQVGASEGLWRPGEHGGALTRESPALVERLRARLGASAVYGLHVVDEHRAEGAWRVTEPVLPTAQRAPCARLAQARRPLWLLREPECLLRGPQDLQLLEGPERIESGWWDGHDVARDYYIARDAEGAERWSPSCNLSDKGYWFAPTIFTGVTQAHRIAREEIFGPVLSILTFRTPQEAIEKANNTPFGLSAGVWSEKGSRILWATQQLRAGVIWANTFNKFDPTSPFGGYKESGWGREGGKHGLASYLKEGK